MRFTVVRVAICASRCLAWLGTAAALAIPALGYGLGVEMLYRPLPTGPATHPLTALSIACLGLAVLLWRPQRRSRWPAVPAAAAALVASARLSDIATGGSLLDTITPFGEVLGAAQAIGRPIATGINTAAMVLLAAGAMLAQVWRRFTAAQVLAFVALGLPLISLTGYAYGVERFYGRMSLATVAIALPVCLSILLASANRAMLRAVLSPWVGGRIARVQILLGYLVPFLIGWGLLRSERSQAELFGLMVVLLSAFISCLISYSAVVQETIDRGRRAAERRLAVAASHDPLTNLPNRRLFFAQAPHELERARRSRTATSVLMIDIDHFKELNDHRGHAAGDRVLRHVAELIDSELRRQDLPARYGGEEFVVLLPDTTAAGAAVLAEKLRRRIAGQTFDVGGDQACALTISIGCAEDSGDGSLQTLLDDADTALYRAKALGRDRVESAGLAGR